MIHLYSMKEVARIFGLREARLRYWVSSGFLWPSVRRGGRFYYTFRDLISVKTAVELLERGLSPSKVRTAVAALRKELQANARPDANARIVSNGEEVVIMTDDVAYEPQSGQLVMAFALSTLQNQIAEVLDLRPDEAVPEELEGAEPTAKQELADGYQLFLEGCEAEDADDMATAERCYRLCLSQEPSLAAAHTNLGNLLYADGRWDEAQACYQQALELDPEQPEARFNLGNLLDEAGETEQAIAALRRVVSHSPSFADAHYNLAVLLTRVGGVAQAKQHLARYLNFDGDSQWAASARRLLNTTLSA